MDSVVGQRCAEHGEKNWYAVYTIVRHEKSVNAALAEKDIETFLPIRKVISRWKDRKKEIKTPLFPGYLFINTPIDNRVRVLNTRGVISILGVQGSPVAVPGEQIESIKSLIETDLYFDPCDYLTRGKEVIVVNGPLEGMKGKIIERRGECRLILSVDLIKRSISVEVDVNDVELDQ